MEKPRSPNSDGNVVEMRPGLSATEEPGYSMSEEIAETMGIEDLLEAPQLDIPKMQAGSDTVLQFPEKRRETVVEKAKPWYLKPEIVVPVGLAGVVLYFWWQGGE